MSLYKKCDKACFESKSQASKLQKQRNMQMFSKCPAYIVGMQGGSGQLRSGEITASWTVFKKPFTLVLYVILELKIPHLVSCYINRVYTFNVQNISWFNAKRRPNPKGNISSYSNGLVPQLLGLS